MLNFTNIMILVFYTALVIVISCIFVLLFNHYRKVIKIRNSKVYDIAKAINEGNIEYPEELYNDIIISRLQSKIKTLWSFNLPRWRQNNFMEVNRTTKDLDMKLYNQLVFVFNYFKNIEYSKDTVFVEEFINMANNIDDITIDELHDANRLITKLINILHNDRENIIF